MGLAAACLIAAVAFRLPAAAAPTDWRDSVRKLAQEHFKQPAWGYSHSIRDYHLARDLAAADHVSLDDDVLFAAAYLHDIAAFEPWANEKIDHSDVGADAIEAILKGSGFPMQKLEAVRGAIRTHMYYRDPKAPEALYLHDADALDWLGAIGVARIIGLVDPKGGAPDGPKAAAMLVENLQKVPSRVPSPGRPGARAGAGDGIEDLSRQLETRDRGLQDALRNGLTVDWVDPIDFFHPFGGVDVEIDHHRFVVAAHQHALERRIAQRVDLLVWHVRRHKDEVSLLGLGHELQPFTPAHARGALHHVDHALQCTVMMCAGFGVGSNDDRPRPELLRPDARKVDGRSPLHAGRLRRIAIQAVAFDHAHARIAPVPRFRLRHQ